MGSIIDRADEVGLNGITHLTFDKNYLLLKTGSTGQNRYLIFSFKSGNIIAGDIQTEEELFEKAGDLNFEGELKLMSLIEYNNLF